MLPNDIEYSTRLTALNTAKDLIISGALYKENGNPIFCTGDDFIELTKKIETYLLSQ